MGFFAPCIPDSRPNRLISRHSLAIRDPSSKCHSQTLHLEGSVSIAISVSIRWGDACAVFHLAFLTATALRLTPTRLRLIAALLFNSCADLLCPRHALGKGSIFRLLPLALSCNCILQIMQRRCLKATN